MKNRLVWVVCLNCLVLSGCTKRTVSARVNALDGSVRDSARFDELCRPEVVRVRLDGVPDVAQAVLGRCTTSASVPLSVSVLSPCEDGGQCSGASVTLASASRVDIVALFDGAGPSAGFNSDPWSRPPSRVTLTNPEEDLSPPRMPMLLLRTVGNQTGESTERYILLALEHGTLRVVADIPSQHREHGDRLEVHSIRFEPGPDAALVFSDAPWPPKVDAGMERRIRVRETSP